jgi:UDPglucose--hexose-1-phosphate uridylyltransferase
MSSSERADGDVSSDRRVDPYSGDAVYVVGSRQSRPNLPVKGCPFCPGGLEAPEPYETRWFKNRWPAMPGDRCEVVLYTPEHDATFWSLGAQGARRVVDLWADRSEALGARDDVDYVLVFENRGPEVGATIPHPHGQIYGYDHVPTRPAELLLKRWRPDPSPGDRGVLTIGGWRAWVPYAPVFPISLTVAPTTRVATLPELDDAGRDDLASILVALFEALDAMWDQPLPYMMWFNQGPFTGNVVDAWLHLEIVSPWRRPGVPRFIAAAEVGGGEYFNPLVPEEVAALIRGSLLAVR